VNLRQLRRADPNALLQREQPSSSQRVGGDRRCSQPRDEEETAMALLPLPRDGRTIGKPNGWARWHTAACDMPRRSAAAVVAGRGRSGVLRVCDRSAIAFSAVCLTLTLRLAYWE
jgi:hypothetical protein